MKTVYSPGLKKMPLSFIFYALNDPVRLEIIRMLLIRKEVSCGECRSKVSKSTMSHHFKVLRESGLIQRREEGTLHYISIRRTEIESRLPGLLTILGRATGPL